jgi:hypothetical protein
MRRALVLVPLAFTAFVAACGGSEPPKNVEPKFQEIAAVHHSKCGGCHRRVERGERTREAFTAALGRHHDRVKNLTDDQWALMIDYLSSPPPAPAQ